MLNRLNDILRGQLAQFRLPVIERHHAHVPIELDGEVMGAFAAWTAPPRTLDATDAAVMRILASQTAVALQNSSLFSTSVNLLAESEARNAELLATQRELGAVQRHQVLDNERHRIARELHDSVAQTVLSAGMLIEVCRSEAAAPELAARLDLAKDLTRSATEQLRSAIYALNHPDDADRSSLIEMLAQLATVHMPEDLRVDLRVTGQAGELPGDVEHALLRIAGEALFNTAMHGSASRAIVSLTYGENAVTLSISDDGVGDPDRLRLTLAVAEAADVDGRHRGLANMRARAREHGGTFRGVPLPPRRGAGGGQDSPRRDGVTVTTTPRTTTTIRLVLVDDHAILRQGLRSILEREPDLQVVGRRPPRRKPRRWFRRCGPMWCCWI